jgi:hypothetical protein
MRWRFPVMDCFWNFTRLWDLKNCCLCFLCFFLTRHPRAQIQSVQWRFFVIVVFVFSFEFLKLFTTTSTSTTTTTTTSYFCIGLYCARERKNGERKKNISKNFLFRAPKIPLPPRTHPKKHKNSPLLYVFLIFCVWTWVWKSLTRFKGCALQTKKTQKREKKY